MITFIMIVLVVNRIRIRNIEDGSGVVSLVLQRADAGSAAIRFPVLHNRRRIEALVEDKGSTVPPTSLASAVESSCSSSDRTDGAGTAIF